MINKKEIVAMLLAGGQGSRLFALTQKKAKPAVSYGGKYKIIDFPLSNCTNSGIDTVGVLTQYEPLELNAYIGTGKVKHKYQFLKKLIRADSLQNEIIQIGKDFDDLIGTFGRHLYNQNGQDLHYEEMGKRLADQRNHFAHGDLSKEFIGLSLLDLIYLEYIIYALQLKHYNIPDDKIRKSINDLFHLNFAL